MDEAAVDSTLVSPTRPLGPSYWRLWWAGAISNVGDGAFAAALPLLAVTITRDPRQIAVVGAATYLPWLLLSLPAGAIVDRYERVGLMRLAQLVQGTAVAAVALLVVTGAASITTLALAGFCLGSAEVVMSNASQSVLPQFVAPDLLARANGNQYVAQTVGQFFVGPPIGSVLFAVAMVAPFGLDALSFLVSATVIGRLPRVPVRDATSAAPVPMRAAIGEGLRWLRRHRLLRTLAVVLAVSNFCNQMGQATLVLLATVTLHLSVRGYGLLLAGAAIGSVVGGLVNARIVSRVGNTAAMTASLAATALIYLLLGVSPNAIVLAGLLSLNGFTSTLWNIATVSLRQRLVPAELLGRVNSVYRMLGWGLIPLGSVAGGLVAHSFGLRAPYPVAGAIRAVALVVALPVLVGASRAAD